MSIHKSLIIRDRLTRRRNVLTRRERIAELIKQGKWTEHNSIFGLPKRRNIIQKQTKTKKEKPTKTGEVTTTTSATDTRAQPVPPGSKKQ